MRIGILGDIHGNLEALTAVVDAMKKEGIDEWVQVGRNDFDVKGSLLQQTVTIPDRVRSKLEGLTQDTGGDDDYDDYDDEESDDY